MKKRKKVIHIGNIGKLEKIELYTELYTLSTKNAVKKEVYIVKNRMYVLWRNNKDDVFGKKVEKYIDNLNIKK